MLKPLAAALALLSTTACMSMESDYATREFTGSTNGCPGLTGVSAIYSHSAPGLPVRCGPQTVAPVTYR